MSATLPADLAGFRIHLVGAKGTGVCALAELLVGAGAVVTGSDVDDTFYTDEVLAAIGVPVSPFSADNVRGGVDLVIYSKAYSAASNPELAEAEAVGVPTMSYPEALGSLSASRDSSGVCGVHGKTTTTALAGVMARAAGLPTAVLVGSAVGAFGGRSTITMGNELLIAETCEYRRSFMAFKPRRVVLTSVEPDHQDYYPDYEAIRAAFVEYLSALPPGGAVVYCADDPGAVDAWSLAKVARPDLRGVPYGYTAPGDFGMEGYRVERERGVFKLRGFGLEWRLRVPGRHVALDAAGAIALIAAIVADRDGGRRLAGDELRAMAEALESFSGSRRRSEVLGEAGGVLFMDDYGHHPTAIRSTLAGLREFYPERRLVVDFMSHTCSRTRAIILPPYGPPWPGCANSTRSGASSSISCRIPARGLGPCSTSSPRRSRTPASSCCIASIRRPARPRTRRRRDGSSTSAPSLRRRSRSGRVAATTRTRSTRCRSCRTNCAPGTSS